LLSKWTREEIEIAARQLEVVERAGVTAVVIAPDIAVNEIVSIDVVRRAPAMDP
jgi:hypothetical protein